MSRPKGNYFLDDFLKDLAEFGILDKSQLNTAWNILELIKTEYDGRMHKSKLRQLMEEVAEATGKHLTTVYRTFNKLKKIGLISTSEDEAFYILSKRFSSKVHKLWRFWESYIR